MELVGRGNGPGLLQQLQRRGLGGAGGLHHGFVFGGVFVGLEQNFVQLLFDGFWAGACAQVGGPLGDLGGDQFLFLDGGQGLGNDIG